jgi:hypothetical protein
MSASPSPNPSLTRSSSEQGFRKQAAHPTMAQLTSALHRVIELGDSIRGAASWVNAQAANVKRHRVTRTTLHRLYTSLPETLRTAHTSSEVLLLDHLQQLHSSQRQQLSCSLSLLTPLEDEMLAQWVQQRCNMFQSPGPDEVIDHARMILKNERDIDQPGTHPLLTALPCFPIRPPLLIMAFYPFRT